MHPNDWVPGNMDPKLSMLLDELAHSPVSSFDDVLEVLDRKSKTNAAKGKVFELLTASFFRMNANHEYSFEEVSLWKDWSGNRDLNDMGIDLVARRRGDQELVAIQCKFYGRKYHVKYSDVAKFLVASRLFGFNRLILLATTGLTESASYAVERWSQSFGEEISLIVEGPAMLEHSNVDWTKFNLAKPVNMVMKEDVQK